MKTRIAAAVALSFLASASSVAFAQAKQQQDTGWYVGLSGGKSNTGFSKQDYSMFTSTVTESTDRSETAWRGLIGYNFDRNWALEGAFTSLGEPTYKYTGTLAGVAGTAQSRVKNDAWSLAVKGTLPVSQQFDIFGRLGWSYNRSELNVTATGTWGVAVALVTGGTSWTASKNRSDAVVGLGVEFKPQKNWGIRAEYENYGRFGNKLNTRSDTGRTDSDMWSIGAVIRF